MNQVAKVNAYKNQEAEEAEFEDEVILEIVEVDQQFVEVAFNIDKRRVYLKFDLSDLVKNVMRPAND